MTVDDALQSELNAATGAFYNPNRLERGTSEVIEIVRYAKNMDTKFPIKDKQGNSKGFCWRFFLRDGRVWDLANANRKVVLQALHRNSTDTMTPTRFRVTNTGVQSTKQPMVRVEPLELGADDEQTPDEVTF